MLFGGNDVTVQVLFLCDCAVCAVLRRRRREEAAGRLRMPDTQTPTPKLGDGGGSTESL